MGLTRAVLFWCCIGLGVLAKGPITPFVAGTCVLGCAAARRDWSFIWRVRPFTGLFVLTAMALPWIWLAGNEVGWDTLRAAFDKEVLQRAKEGAEGHAAPPGYYIHELGGARLSSDPDSGVLDPWNRCWGASNVLVTDGASWPSSAWQSPTLTSMALTWRACEAAAARLRRREG